MNDGAGLKGWIANLQLIMFLWSCTCFWTKGRSPCPKLCQDLLGKLGSSEIFLLLLSENLHALVLFPQSWLTFTLVKLYILHWIKCLSSVDICLEPITHNYCITCYTYIKINLTLGYSFMYCSVWDIWLKKTLVPWHSFRLTCSKQHITLISNYYFLTWQWFNDCCLFICWKQLYIYDFPFSLIDYTFKPNKLEYFTPDFDFQIIDKQNQHFKSESGEQWVVRENPTWSYPRQSICDRCICTWQCW